MNVLMLLVASQLLVAGTARKLLWLIAGRYAWLQPPGHDVRVPR